jgi:hypothetical protein
MDERDSGEARMRIQDTAPAEFARHSSAIEALAREACAEPAYVKELYERQLDGLEAHVKVRDYLPVLACRVVRSALREQRAKAE